MHPILKQTFDLEKTSAKNLYKESKYKESFSHLERAHILGQLVRLLEYMAKVHK
ncbi:DUF3703 domain-containing protein [Leptospira terpstrae]|uniref:DUF3703 domain-containing protein n=1 Tax=Leptospira terpstrae TaxID=293075 RepID=UPI003D01851F